MKTKKKSGKTLWKSVKSRGKIREFDGIKQVILIQVKTVAAGKLQIIETSMMLTIALFNDSKHIVKLEA